MSALFANLDEILNPARVAAILASCTIWRSRYASHLEFATQQEASDFNDGYEAFALGLGDHGRSPAWHRGHVLADTRAAELRAVRDEERAEERARREERL